ncbi:thioredoxin [bacterium]|nr:thioredoxin [bacterium]
MAEHITDADFEEKVTNHNGLVLVDFWAPWCGPCRILGPEIEKLSEEMADKMKIYKLNVDENRVTAAKFRVMSIPTVMWFKDGKIIESVLGAVPFEALKEKTVKLLGE